MSGYSTEDATFTLQRDTSDEEVIRIIQEHTTKSMGGDYVEIKHALMQGNFRELKNLASYFIEQCTALHPEFRIRFQIQKRGFPDQDGRNFRCISWVILIARRTLSNGFALIFIDYEKNKIKNWAVHEFFGKNMYFFPAEWLHLYHVVVKIV